MRLFSRSLLLLLLCSCAAKKSEHKSASSIYESQITVVEKFLDGKKIKGTGLTDAILFLEELTSIDSEVGDGFVDTYEPTLKNVKDWNEWYKSNKHLLYWDESEQKVKLKKE